MDIFLIKNNLYIKTNKDIDLSYLDSITQKITIITYSYKLSNLVLDIKDKTLEKNLINKFKSYNIKKQIL